jgi:hypothetical protein
MTDNVTTLPPPRDPIFALAPELQLHQSKLDGQFVVNSREVARVFLRDDHRELIRHIMWSIWNDPMQASYHDEFRQRPDGTVAGMHWLSSRTKRNPKASTRQEQERGA